MIQALDSDFWTSCGTRLQEGNGSYIVSYFDDDDDDDYDDDDGGGGDYDDGDGVKAEMIPVLKRATGTFSTSFRKYLSNIPGKHEIKEAQKKKNSHIGHCTHV